MAETEQPESEPNMIGPQTDTSAPTKRPATLAEFLERYPLPWRPYRIDSLSGAEWEIEAANGQLVPNHGGRFCLKEYAEVFAELGNELGRLRAAVLGCLHPSSALYQDWNRLAAVAGIELPALADTAAPAAQNTEATDDGR